MLFRRFALAVAIICAAVLSQLPEFTQQYRQRLGGAIDELKAIIAQFDTEAADQSLTRDQAIARLKGNPDPLAQGRGTSIDETAARTARLERQREAFETAGPLSQWAIFAEGLDPGIASRTLGTYQPALPVTVAGLVAAAIGFLVGWTITHLAGRPFRRRPHETRRAGATPVRPV